MDISSLCIGILHSIVGGNDGVSIVIDQSVQALTEYLGVPPENIHFLAGRAPARANTRRSEIFWHKNDINRYIVSHYSDRPPDGMRETIEEHVAEAENVIGEFVATHDLDLLIAHNTSHAYNFIAAVALGRYLEKRRARGMMSPKCLTWWHDSHYERAAFADPNTVMSDYIRYLPTVLSDGLVVINSCQLSFAREHFATHGERSADLLLEHKTAVIPNTCEIPWDWHLGTESGRPLAPPLENYNRTFLDDAGITAGLRERGATPENTLFLLQHTRIVPRKRIDAAIDFAFALARRREQQGRRQPVCLLVSGPSYDKPDTHRQELTEYFRTASARDADLDVLFVMAEHIIVPHRGINGDRKLYSFGDIPGIIAGLGGLGTYFSEVEGFGNNLLEMMAAGLPVVTNRFPVYDSDLAQYGFDLPTTRDCAITPELIDQATRLLDDTVRRNTTVRHNLDIMERRLSHRVLAERLKPVIRSL
ncbi:MAG: hypothetical protein QGH42_07765 [Kiritimatiellia bacterium]|jgi:glycosyltransferase involved in cell wall biosynthesis|nr:hypothetical protein [Kiritimatiellia bacterium]MDP6630856.1 hypothetical protein [Kiritimatiellia bacterium]MDP6811265.1 hypothetical protein [Kiritimatiellia bacterium]MDP7024121.1 hypothetical protein [Kiritimatiellia bacterium]